MNILAVDTSSSVVNIMLKKDEQIFCSELDSFKNTSEKLLPMIEELLNDNNLLLKDIDFLALNIGPGSFTGIRIAMSLFKGFMCSTNLKCVTVNSFEIYSYNIKDEKFCLLLDSGTPDFYALISDNKVNTWASFSVDKVIELKDEYKIYSNVEIENLDTEIVELNRFNLMNLALEKIEKGEFVEDFALEPLYVKKAQAERELKQKFLQNIEIKKTTILELNKILMLEKQNFPNDFYNENQLKSDIENNLFLSAYYNEKLVGYINILVTDVYEILKICVDETYRKMGIGERLIENIKTDKDIFLEVSENNKAKHFYSKLGFRIYNIRKNYYKDGSNALCMKKIVKIPN